MPYSYPQFTDFLVFYPLQLSCTLVANSLYMICRYIILYCLLTVYLVVLTWNNSPQGRKTESKTILRASLGVALKKFPWRSRGVKYQIFTHTHEND